MTYFHGDESKIKYSFEKTNKMADSKKMSFSKSTISKKNLLKFQRLVFGLVELIDEKGIDLAQPIWL